MSYTQESLDQYLELMGEPSEEEIAWIQSILSIKKARVYVKSPSQVPIGHKVGRGERGGFYYETEAREAQQEDTQESAPVQPIQSYDELKTSRHYAGSTEMYNNETKAYDKYDVFKFDNADIRVKADDIPTDAHEKIMECAESFKFSSLKLDKPVIKFLGKSFVREFNWQDRDGKQHTSNYGGMADYGANDISIYDDYNIADIVYHEIGHFVYKKIMSSVDAKPDPSINGLVYLDRIEDYTGMLEILRAHNVPTTPETIEKILDSVDYAKQLGILDDMQSKDLKYYDRGYNALSAMNVRLKGGYIPDITPMDKKQWKKYRTLMTQELKANTVRNEWYDIWKTEGYKTQEYANRNNSETFAEFYQSMDRILRYPEESKQKHLARIAVNNPLKTAFFKKYVMRAWMK